MADVCTFQISYNSLAEPSTDIDTCMTHRTVVKVPSRALVETSGPAVNVEAELTQ